MTSKWGLAIFTSDKIDFKTKAIMKDKEGHYIMIKVLIQEDIIFINIYAPNTRALLQIKLASCLLGCPLSKRQEIANIDKDVEKRECLYTVGGDIN